MRLSSQLLAARGFSCRHYAASGFVGGEVVISVKAASVNFPDVLIIQNKYQYKPPLPFSPSSELAGVVKAVGADVKNVKPGDKVIAFTTYGAFAEEVKTESARLLPIKALGARVIACASSDDKLAVCHEHGADEAINYAAEDLRERIKALTGAKGVDVIYDAVGGPYSTRSRRSAPSPGAAGDIPKLPLNLALLKGAAVVGVFWGDYTRREPQHFAESARQLGRWYREGKLKPHVSATFPLEKAADAMNLLASRKARGKVVVTIGA